MDKNRVFKRRGRRRAVGFNPSHEFIEDSVKDFLEKGGKIKKIEQVNNNYENFVSMPDTHSSADDFLFEK
ncbi:MAG: hypothetical protein MJE63_26675 [Proteobacteria bacterium]|nr:hypothetical protein [Pseudomonadota bacterium]